LNIGDKVRCCNADRSIITPFLLYYNTFSLSSQAIIA